MNSKRISAVFMLLVICLVPLYLLLFHGRELEERLPFHLRAVEDGSFARSVETFVKEEFPFKTGLQQLAIGLRYKTGQVEQNGIFITEKLLLENLQPPDEEMVEKNRRGVQAFVEGTRKPTYLMLIPTAVAIKQQEVPEFAAATLFNQKNYIEYIYNGFSGTVSVVDVYPALFAAKEDALYYKTENNLTGLGGYEVYTVLGKRLGLGTLKGLEQFDIQYYDNRFYGEVYEKSPYKDIEPDVLALYRFSRYRREYRVTHYTQDGQKSYYTLYPQSAATVGKATDIYFGGLPPVLDIQTTAQGGENLLIFGDKTITSYLPFLLTHYSRVTVVNLGELDEEILQQIRPEAYEQVLLAYSLESYIHTSQLDKLTAFAQKTEG